MEPKCPPKYVPGKWFAEVLPCYRHLTSAHPVLAEVNVHPEVADVRYDVHPGFELGFSLSGEQTRIVSDVALPILPGDVWLVCAWELHGFRGLSPKTTVIPLIFLSEFLGEETLAGVPWWALFAAPPGQRPRVRSEGLRAQVLAIAAELREEIEAKAPGWEDAVRYHILRVLLALRREWEPPRTVSSPGLAPTTDLLRIMPALQTVQTDSMHRVSLEQAAAQCELSASRFAVLFRRTMGMSFGRFVQNTRMAQVAQQLIASDQPIETIAAQLGFTDDSHLHRLFLKHYQMTPAAYRSRMK